MQINFTHQGLRSQRQSLEQFFGSFSRHGAALKLTSLEFTHMPRIDIHLLALIAREVPALRMLRIISTDGLDTACCPNCYEDSLSRIVHSPIPHLYEDVHALSVISCTLSWILAFAHTFLILDAHRMHSDGRLKA